MYIKTKENIENTHLILFLKTVFLKTKKNTSVLLYDKSNESCENV